MQFADISLTDAVAGSATFTAMTKDGLLAEWKDKSVTPPVMRPAVTCALRKADGSTPRKVTIKLTFPFSYTDGGVTTQALSTSWVTFIVNENMSAADLNDLIAFTSGIVNAAQVKATITDGEFPA